MVVIRRKIQQGFLRLPATLVAGLSGFTALAVYWQELLNRNVNPLDAGSKIAFVAAAFAVTAYNLRVRVIDLILKVESDPDHIDRLCIEAKDSGRKLTNLVLLFTICALALGGLGFLPKEYHSARWSASVATGLFAMSCVQYIYVLFGFEVLEKLSLEDARKKSRLKEAERLTKHEVEAIA